LGGPAREVAARGLPADHATPAEQRAMGELQAGLAGLVVEDGHRRASLLLGMPVVAVPDAKTRPLDARQRIAQFAAQVPPVLAQGDIGHRAVVVIVIVIVIVGIMAVSVIAAVPVVAVGIAGHMLMGQQAVAVVLPAPGQAQVATIANEAATQAVALGVVV